MNFPKIKGKQYATLSKATVNLQDMAEQTISTQIKINGDITPYFLYNWAIEYKGNKYIFPFRIPPGSIDESSTEATINLTFQHWAIYELKRQYFFSVPNMEADAVIPDKYIAPVSLNLTDFVKLYAMVLEYYYDDKITIDLNEGYVADVAPVVVEINYSTLWDVLIKIYELYGVRWQIEPNGDIDHYVIKVGYPAPEVGHIFQYGFDGGLMKFERQAQDDTVKNIILGRGGGKNLPYRYFKKHDEDNETFSADPDWIPELKDIYFSELHGATFRSYIQGWKAKHIDEYRREYPDEEWQVTTPTAEDAYAPWAWQKGYTDSKFDPVEYVKDDDSIQRYGELHGALGNNEDIYPTIQGIEADGLGRIDETVSIEEIESDEIEKDTTGYDTEIFTPSACRGTVYSVPANGRKEITIRKVGPIYIDSGKHGDLIVSVSVLSVKKPSGASLVAAESAEITPNSQSVTVVNSKTGAQQSASGIPDGVWYYDVTVEVHNLTADILNVEVGDMSPKLITSTIRTNPANTWHIWLKNLWGTTKQPDETEAQYAKRVWEPILGDHTGEEAKVIFTDGMLALSEDYEFTIVSIPEYDTTKALPVKNLQGNITGSYPSHWKLTLAKCDADFDTTGAYLPSTKRFAKAGDHIAFIGIDMPHLYVVEAEKRLDDWKKDNLEKYKDIKPTILVTLDKVRIHNYGKPGALAEHLQPGNSVRVADKRFILNADGTPASYETLFIQSVTYTYNEATETEANLLPDIEVTLSDQYESTANPVAMLSSEINELHRQIGSISNVTQVVQRVGDKRYLRKDISDRASASIDFMQGLDSYGKSILREGVQFGATFAEGAGGIGGKIDCYGDAWLGGLRLRDFLEVPELRYNRTEITVGNAWRAPGGGVIESVTPDYDSDGNIGTTGVIKLHLEDGEIGAVFVGDLCMGIFHNEAALSANTELDSDDGRGNFTFAGFCTVYFKVTELLETGKRSAFRYELRPTSTRWPWANHPSAQMSFVAYGSISAEDRKTSRYSTRTYERYLVNVGDWEFGAENIAAQFGDLTNLSIFGLDMSGYSAYLNNIYLTGRIEQIDLLPRLEIDYGNDNFIAYGTSKQITSRLFRGWEDITDNVSDWRIVRNTGNIPQDLLWTGNHLAEIRDNNGSIAINYDDEDNDLGAMPENGAKFTIYAKINGEEISQSVKLWPSPIDGTDGVGISSITNKYAVSNSATTAPTTWQDTVPTMTATNRYLWNYEIISYSDGTETETERRVIGVYGDAGADGKGIVGITEHYFASASDSGVTTSSSGWTTEIQTITAENKYLWNYETITYTDGTSVNSTPVIIGVYGDTGTDGQPGKDGVGIISTTITYAIGTSATTAPASGWQSTIPSVPEGQYLWTKTVWKYSDETIETGYSVARQGTDGVDGDKGDKGEAGEKGAQGIQGCVYRMTQWRSGIEYHNDSALTDDDSEIRYIDVVLIPNPLLATKAYAFICRSSHTSSSDNAPSTSADNEWWLRLNNMSPIYTPLLLADNAVITLLQSNQLIVMKDDGTTVNVGLGGGEYPLWIGATEATEAKFCVDATGRAFMTGAEISGKITAGDSDGQRVDLLPDDKSLKIYNSSGSEVSSFEGNSYSAPTDMFGSASGNISMKLRTATSYGYGSGVSLGHGSRALYGDNSGLVQRTEDVIISNTIHTPSPVEFVVSGALATTYTPPTAGPDGVLLIDRARATISLHLDTYSDSGLTNRVGTQEIKRYSDRNGTAVISQKRIKATSGGYHVLRITMVLMVQGGSDISASVKWGSAITGQSDIYGVYTSDFYVSRYFANGLCLGISEANYVMVYNQDNNLGMRLKMENSGYGFDVSGSGIKYRHHGGDWVNMPMFVMKARYGYSNNAYVRNSGKSFNGDLPEAERISQGSVRLTFPSSWASQLTLSEENLIVNVVGYGNVAEGGASSVKASVLNITSTYITIALADDNTPNDGAFLINVYYME